MHETDRAHARRPAPSLLAIGMCLIISACEDASTRSSAMDPDWTLESQRLLDITGVYLGEDSLHLYRIGKAVFTDVDKFVITLEDESSNALLSIDLQGNLLATAGGSGHAPGQYRDISNLQRANGGVAVWDRLNGRLTRLDRELTVTEMIPFSVPTTHQVVAFNDPGVLISTPKTADAVRGQPRRYYTWRAATDPPSMFTGPLEAADGRIVLQYTSPSQPAPISYHTTLAPFCLPAILHAEVHGQLAVIETGPGRVWIFNLDGEGQEVFESGASPIVSPDMVQGVREQFDFIERQFSGPMMGPAGPVSMARGEFSQGAIDSVLSLIGEPGERLPSHWDKIVPDTDDQLWLRRAKCRSSIESFHTWDVIDVEGNHVATAATPASFDLKALSTEYALGVALGEYDLERLLIFRIKRP